MEDPLTRLDQLFSAAGIAYVVIGAHAVNTWVEPRFTADIDVTVAASVADLERLRQSFADAGLALQQEHGQQLPSGPDFLRFASADPPLTVELQAAKTVFQREVIRRAVTSGGVRTATAEDLIVMKLIADRPKDRVDAAELGALPSLDWSYIEHWAREWDILDRLHALRSDR